MEAADYSVEDDAHRLLPARDWEGHRVPYKVRLDGNGLVLSIATSTGSRATRRSSPTACARPPTARAASRGWRRGRRDDGGEVIDHACGAPSALDAPEAE